LKNNIKRAIIVKKIMVEANESASYVPKLTGKKLISVSKAMSYVLRHGAEKEGIEMRADGYIKLSDLLAVKSLKQMKVGEA
jgi:RNA:NAD 2'-phosphotransferase (TPT1/KptA family)